MKNEVVARRLLDSRHRSSFPARASPQCLAAIPALVRRLLEHKIACVAAKALARAESAIAATASAFARGGAPPCAACAVAAVLVALCGPEVRAKPVQFSLANNPAALGGTPALRAGAQEDAHEFLRRLLDALHNRAQALASAVEGWHGRLDETTFVCNIFGGYLQNTVSCPRCDFDSITNDAYLDLCLDIGRPGAGGAGALLGSVDDALARFCAVEKLDAGNRWTCPRCAAPVCATKRLALSGLAPVLCAQLKRFCFDERGEVKLDGSVAFGATLDATPALTAAARAERGGAPAIYDLVGVLVHHGSSTNLGHYFSFVKAADGGWRRMDDEVVENVAWATVTQQQAYMLFYILRAPGAVRVELDAAPASASALAPALDDAALRESEDLPLPVAAALPLELSFTAGQLRLPSASLPDLASLAVFPALSGSAPECAPPPQVGERVTAASGSCDDWRNAGAQAHAVAAFSLRDPSHTPTGKRKGHRGDRKGR